MSTELFFQLPSETSGRVLHPVEVVEVSDGVVTACFEEPGFAPEPDQNVLVYYEIAREFMQQSAQVVAVLETEPTATFAFKVTGDPVSAEGRECYRARAMFLDVMCRVGDERDCPLQDVSATGLAVLAAPGLKIGDTVGVSFTFDGTRVEGTVCVQSVRELASGRVRYGLHSIGREKVDREFRDALNHVSLAVQRLQLKRLSGTG